MTYSQTFKGTLRFSSAHRLEAGLDALAAYDDPREGNAITIDDLEIDGLGVRLDYDNFLPASMSFGTCSALRLLASHALSGTIRVTYEGEPTDAIQAEGRRDDGGLPPRHHRWEIRAAARAGSAKALRALKAAGVDIAADRSALDFASAAGSLDAIRVLLDAGAKADTRALSFAKNRATAEALLRAGASPNPRGDERRPLAVACHHDRADVAFVLLRAGAKLPPKKEALVEMLGNVARSGNLELLKALARDPTARRALLEPSVISAANDAKRKKVVAWLSKQGATIPEEPPSIEDVANAWNAGRYEESLSLLRKMQYEDEDTFGLAGVSHGFLGRHARAIDALRKSVDHDPDNAMWRNGLAYFLAAAGRSRDAATEYRKALKQIELDLADEPEDAAIWSRKAYALNGLGRSKEALDAANRAIAIEADHTLALVNAGRALLATSQPKEARKMLERAVKSDPVLAEPKLYLAIARARCGDMKGAKNMIAKIIVSPHLVALAKKEPSLRSL